MRISDGSSDVCSSDLEAFHEWAEQEDGWVADNAETAITEGRADLLRRIDAEKARADADEKSRRELEGPVQERGVAEDRKSVGKGTSVSVSVDLGGRRIIKKKKSTILNTSNATNMNLVLRQT